MDTAGNVQPLLIATITPVPEPTTLALMLAGLGTLAAQRRKRKKSQSGDTLVAPIAA